MGALKFGILVILAASVLSQDEIVGDKTETIQAATDEDTVKNNGSLPNDKPDNIDGRIRPTQKDEQPYIITAQRLQQIRANFMYWFYDQGGNDNFGDYQPDIHSSTPQIHKNFNFQLPFFGFRFNYTRLSMNGHLSFSNPPDHYTYPLSFPMRDWPSVNDPSFIGIFFSKCRIGSQRPQDPDQRRPGVYFRIDRDLQNRTDQLGVEMRERITWDIREGIIGAETFSPKHAVTVTWKNISFAGGIDNALFVTNTFQMILATDEEITYTIFNYADINWSSHTEAGGDTTDGIGGVSAYIGFNAGNGTQSYEYEPYSQSPKVHNLQRHGWSNGFPGRHIFRVDENIFRGTCDMYDDNNNHPLMFAPKSGNMLGGTIVNITGPCFNPDDIITCLFDTEFVFGDVIDKNRAMCVQPQLWHNGYIKFAMVANNGRFKWKGKYFVETPANAAPNIFFSTKAVYERSPSEIRITWDPSNMNINPNVQLQISLWGYREATNPQIRFIDIIDVGVANTGEYMINPQSFRNRDNYLQNDIQVGFLQINFTSTENDAILFTPILWSLPIPLGWYFGPQWERLYGQDWPKSLCTKRLEMEKLQNYTAHYTCPCTLNGVGDFGNLITSQIGPSREVCFKSIPSSDGSSQQCCYDKDGFQIVSYDQELGSQFIRSHNFGAPPYNKRYKVPSLSHWVHDLMPNYYCCKWQDESLGCRSFRFIRRLHQDCTTYQNPGSASIYRANIVTTFNNFKYIHEANGEYVLLKVDDIHLDVQGRFEQVPSYSEENIPIKSTQLTQLTYIAAVSNQSSLIEVRLRPQGAQSRYMMDIFVDNTRLNFNKPSNMIQSFPGVTVYSPPLGVGHSVFVIMFTSGVGIVLAGPSTRVPDPVKPTIYLTLSLPRNYVNQSRGLLGAWSSDKIGIMRRPDGTKVVVDTENFQPLYRDFTQYWQLTDTYQKDLGKLLLRRDHGRNAIYYSGEEFIPNIPQKPIDIPVTQSDDIGETTISPIQSIIKNGSNEAAPPASDPEQSVKLNTTAILENKTDMNEYDALGVIVSRKLAKMNTEQAIYAETIIHKVLRMGLLNRLREDTNVN